MKSSLPVLLANLLLGRETNARRRSGVEHRVDLAEERVAEHDQRSLARVRDREKTEPAPILP